MSEKTAREELAELLAAEAAEEVRTKADREEEAAKTELDNRKLFRELKAKLGSELKRVDTDAGMIVLKRVSNDTYRHFLGMARDPIQKALADEVLAAASVVHPDPETFASLCEKFPALSHAIANLQVEFAGNTANVKKA